MRRGSSRPGAGYTLIELMVTSAVAIAAAAALTTGFLGLNRLIFVQEGIRAGQASLRHSLGLMLRQLRNAGYGVEPWVAFDFPSGWSDDPTRNHSDRLVFRARDPQFGRKLTAANPGALTLAQPLDAPLKQGQILQVVCPGAVRWTYAQLAADAPAGETSLSLGPPPSTWPRDNADLAQPCYGGMGADPAYVFKIDVYDYEIELIDDDGVAATPPLPFLFRRHGLGAPGALGEPVADNIEALRVTFLRMDPTGSLIAFTPNPGAPAPTYDSAPNAPEHFNDNPANIAAVRVGITARAGVVDPELRKSGLENVIPGFAGRPDLLGPAGFRRVLFETTVPVRNLRSVGMFLPPFTADTTPTACRGTAPGDGFNCISG